MFKVAVLVAQRLALGILILAGVAVVIFYGSQLLPGDVAETILGKQATPASVAALRHELHLDRPPSERFREWVWGIANGDLGTSLANGTPVVDLIGERLQNTLYLALLSALIAVPLSIGMGIVSVTRNGTLFDRVLSSCSLTFISLPEFFLGYGLMFVFSVYLNWVPNLSNVYAGMGVGERLLAMALPSATLVLVTSAHMIRMTRVAILNLLDSPYIEMARLKGLSHYRVIGVHALANAVAPIVTVVVLNMAYLIVGVVVVEVVFVYPGLGQLMVDSVSKRDIPVVQATAMIFSGSYIVLNIVADLISHLANPRLRFPR